ncbi:MAG: hypothetical protein QGF09_07290, partial [Rhodospirillales bacterium]|nr:hypothetical protein [Rhodospirillales bacterium]
MLQGSLKFSAILLVSAFFLGACGGPDPYIFDKDEFNRKSANFGRELKDRSLVQVCYNSQSTTPQFMLQMANVECAKFGKRAVFRDQDLLECPLTTPARANFSCV